MCAFRRFRAFWRGLCWPGRIAFATALVAAVIYGGGKGRIVVDDPYVQDAGSYLTNDVAHVAIAKRTPLLPDDAEILVYFRDKDSTNAVDWVRLEPHLAFADHPFDYPLPGPATNYSVMVAANYVPAPTVHTNGVWSIAGFVIPASGGKMGFKSARTERPGWPTAADYVQDGLIAMWDGIENAGWGVHDPNATVWTNLAQDKWHLTVNAAAVWTDNSARKPTTAGYNIALWPTALTAAEENLARTVEIVATWSGRWQNTGNSNNKVAMLFNWGQSGNGGKTFFMSAQDGNLFSAQCRPANSTRFARSGSLSLIPVGRPFQLSADFAASMLSRPTRLSLNGSAMAGTTAIGRDSAGGIELGGPPGHHYYLLGDIHCVRVYSRVLTAAELENNLEIDKARFNLQ